jgi:hypothetical protein
MLTKGAFFALSVLGLSFACSAGKSEPEEPPPVLFGFDPGVPRKPPSDCKQVGKIKASSIGKDSFPEDAIREEAKKMGANAVARIKKDGEEDHFLGRQRHFRATALYCKNLPAAAPSASVQLEELEPEDNFIPEMGQ